LPTRRDKAVFRRCLTGQREVDAGSLLISPSVPVGYLEQTAMSGSSRSVWVEAKSKMASTLAEAELAAAQTAVEGAARPPPSLPFTLQPSQRTHLYLHPAPRLAQPSLWPKAHTRLSPPADVRVSQRPAGCAQNARGQRTAQPQLVPSSSLSLWRGERGRRSCTEQVKDWERQHIYPPPPLGVVVERGCTLPARGATTRAPHQLSV
jgi:hypothetical protein